MSRGRMVEIELIIHSGERCPGTIRVQDISERDANSAGLKFMFGCFGACFIMVLVPPHVPWVLILVTVGVLGFYFKSKERTVKLGGEGICPKCSAMQILDSGTSEIPFVHYCEFCRSRMDAYEKGKIPEEIYKAASIGTEVEQVSRQSSE